MQILCKKKKKQKCEFRINFLFHKEAYPYYTKFHYFPLFNSFLISLKIFNFSFFSFFFGGQKSKSLFQSCELDEKAKFMEEGQVFHRGSNQFHCLQFPRVLGTFGCRGQHPFSGSASENTNGHTPPKLFPSTSWLLWMCTPYRLRLS